MEKNSIFIRMTIVTLSVLFIILSIIPVIGPGFGAYVLGKTVYSHRHQGLSNIHMLTAITIGELIYFFFSSFLLSTIIEFYESGMFWQFIITAFFINYIFSIILYFWGNRKAKKVITV